MQVILQEDVKKIGKKDDVVTVSDGYARNFLFTKGLAVEATKNNLAKLKTKKEAQRFKKETEKNEAQKIAEEINKITLKVKVKTGEKGKLFGGVSNKEIAEKLEEEYHIKIDKKKIELKESIKNLGITSVNIKLYEGVVAKLKVFLIS